jgi:hypothetical protein
MNFTGFPENFENCCQEPVQLHEKFSNSENNLFVLAGFPVAIAIGGVGL